VRVAARDVPPDRETAEGVERRALLMKMIADVALVPTPGPLPVEAIHIASDLVEVADLPSGGPERRLIEELVWARLGTSRPCGLWRRSSGSRPTRPRIDKRRACAVYSCAPP
jgi:hypothetical protein